jgi:hypothetical protein
VPQEFKPTAQYRYSPVLTPDGCPDLRDHLADTNIYEIALCLGYVPTVQEFAQFLESGEIQVWQVSPRAGGAPVAFAIDSHIFGDHETYVHLLGPWQAQVATDVLADLAAHVFATDTTAKWVYSAVPLAVAKQAQAAWVELGWDVIRSDTDRGLKKTFGLERSVYALYKDAG